MDKSYCNDCCTTCFCWGLTNCQHAREVEAGLCLPNGSEYYNGEAPSKPQQQTVVVVNAAQPGAYAPQPGAYAPPPPGAYAAPPPPPPPPQ